MRARRAAAASVRPQRARANNHQPGGGSPVGEGRGSAKGKAAAKGGVLQALLGPGDRAAGSSALLLGTSAGEGGRVVTGGRQNHPERTKAGKGKALLAKGKGQGVARQKVEPNPGKGGQGKQGSSNKARRVCVSRTNVREGRVGAVKAQRQGKARQGKAGKAVPNRQGARCVWGVAAARCGTAVEEEA